MNFEECIANATATESPVDFIRYNRAILENLLEAAVHVGTAIDMVKKDIYYSRPIDLDDLETHLYSGRERLFDATDGTMNYDDRTDIKVDARVLHSALGMVTESAEVVEGLSLNGEYDRTNLLEEVFDTFWYQFIMLDALGADGEKVIKMGFDKLRSRYPEAFTDAHANNRNLEKERKILEAEGQDG